MKNEGKIFELDFAKSVPDKVLLKRLNDNAASWTTSNAKFSSTNECDYLMYDEESRCFYGLELKTTKSSLTYWREDFEEENSKKNFGIRKCQIQGLEKWNNNHIGVYGFIFNFREHDNDTYFVYIDEFLKYTSNLDKKSIGIKDVIKMNPIKIDSEKKRVHYKYDVKGFIKNTVY